MQFSKRALSCGRKKTPACLTNGYRMIVSTVFQPSWTLILSIYHGIDFHSYNAKYKAFSDLQKAKLFCLPPPSDFGKGWSAFEDRLLCCRPPDARGLPLRIPCHVRRYCLNVQKPLPRASETAVAAMDAAKRLCASMGNSFSTKSDSSRHGIIRKMQEFASLTSVFVAFWRIMKNRLSWRQAASWVTV